MKTMKKIVAILAVALMLCSILPLSVAAADTYELATSIEVGDTVVLACQDKKMELSGISTTSTKYGLGVAYSSTPAGAYVLTVEAGSTSGTYSFKCPNGQYLYWTSGNSLATNATKSANTSWTVTFSGNNAIIKNAKDTTRQLQWNASSPRFACYGNSGQTAVQLFKKAAAPAPSDCEHENAEYDFDCVDGYCPDCEEELPAKAGHRYEEEITAQPTCTEAGEKTLTCACGDEKTEAIPALGHDFSEGDICSVCNAEKPLEATITFDADKTQRTEYTTSVQKWENDGLTLINNKASSTTNIGDYSNPGRFYKSSTITISFTNMVSLVINAPSGEYGTPWGATLSNAGYTYTNVGTVYTVTFAEPVDSITLTCSAQIRANSITAYGAKKACEHEYDNACDNECNNCGEANPDYADHVYDHEFDATCNVCDAERAVAGPISYVGMSKSEDVKGLAMLFQADVEGIVVKAGTFVQADFTNATYNGYKLLELGVIASNGVSETTIKGERMYELEDGVAKFAFRVINIPENKLDVEITMTPYYVVEIDGVATTVYGTAQTGSYDNAQSAD